MIWIVLIAAYLIWVFYKPYLKLNYTSGERYLTRWRFLNTSLGGVYLHRVDNPDIDRHPHNHMWNALVLVLWKPGPYRQQVWEYQYPHVIRYSLSGERMQGGGIPGLKPKLQNVGRINRLGAQYHKITEISKGTWTLVFFGKRRAEPWGFLVNDQHMPWYEYLTKYQKGVLNAKGTVSGKKLK